MTEADRKAARVLIDEARRVALRTQRIHELNERDGVRLCAYCDEPFQQTNPQASRQRFCSATHKANWWRKERRERARLAA